MKCNKHDDMVVLWAFSDGECEKCKKEIMTHYTPCHILCEECSKKLNLCEICGAEILVK